MVHTYIASTWVVEAGRERVEVIFSYTVGQAGLYETMSGKEDEDNGGGEKEFSMGKYKKYHPLEPPFINREHASTFQG